jgi:hypothetical protein
MRNSLGHLARFERDGTARFLDRPASTSGSWSGRVHEVAEEAAFARR